jgi:hypothetical protein
MCGILSILPFSLQLAHIVFLLLHVMSMLNKVPSGGMSEYIAPMTALTGRAVYMKDIRHPFMSYVEAEDRPSDTVLNSVTVSCTRPCLVLYPADNLQHSWKLYTLDTEQVITRNVLFPEPMAHAIINLMNERTRKTKGVLRNP